MRQLLSIAALSLVLAACGTGIDLGNILGSSSPSNPSDIVGTVNSVNTSNQTIDVDVSYVNNLRTSQQATIIYYDSNTVVEYQNQRYSPADLERGDQVSIRGSNQSGRYVAQTITVTRNVRG